MEEKKNFVQHKRARQLSAPRDHLITPSDCEDSLAKKPREQSQQNERCDLPVEPSDKPALTQSSDLTSSAGPPSDLHSSVEPQPSDLQSSIEPSSLPSGSFSSLSTSALKSAKTEDGRKSGELSEKCGRQRRSASRPGSRSSGGQDTHTPSPQPKSEDCNIGNESDSDLDYDDLDDLVVPSDSDDFEDVDDDGESGGDDHSVASTNTTMSTGSVGSNTPSMVGESLESVSLGLEPARKKVHSWVTQAPNLTDSPALRRSLFSHVPPTINFMLHNETSALQLPDEIRKLLKWRLSTITPAIVKRCAANSGFRLMRKTCLDWTATWGKHMKYIQFKEVKEGQKINHFPGTFNIGRKDKLWRNYHKLMLKFGKSEFGFLPRTFVLPADTKLLKKVWERRGGRGRWIVKPPALARGEGISVVNKFSMIPKNKPLVVQRYVARPYLINGTKFDLRLYLLVTSINPLKMYLYDDGLVRFASNKYSNDSRSVGDVYMHLTNYSINKNSSTYTQNEDSESCQGHKWTLKSLWRHFEAEGIDHEVVWEKIKDLMIKTVISAESSMNNMFNQNVSSRYSCYELFGFDILLDSKLKPWLIEVNISPSLHSSSSLDLDVKSPLTTEVFDMARYHIPSRMKTAQQREFASQLGYDNLVNFCQDRRLYVKEISKAERTKHDDVVGAFQASPDLDALAPLVLESLTPDDTRQLVVAEDELATTRRFQRIFPTGETQKYFKYFDKPRYYNLLLATWEQRYGGLNREAGRAVIEKLCRAKHHLKVPANVYVKKTSSGQQTIDISGLAAPSSQTDSQKTEEVVEVEPVKHAVAPEALMPSHVRSSKFKLRVEDDRRFSSGSEMDCGSVSPSPRGTPEHPGQFLDGPGQFLDGNSGSNEILAGNAAILGNSAILENYALAGNGDTNLKLTGIDNLVTRTTTTELTTMDNRTTRDDSQALDNRMAANNLILDN